ncbi:hypothetical protein [Propionicicella superfundia]|uniref:hypothetical protein n=1 Tax=Propionicicella superfundia TaxID=348582 RepID=UPI0004191D42|nr:hypothetical protein [Propionicicella superfundia]
MKVLKIILLAVGLIGLIIAGSLLFMTVMIDIKVIWEIATRYGTTSGLKDPRQTVLVIAALAAGAGLALGVGLSLPTRFAPSQKKLDELVEARIQERLAEPAPAPAPEADEA